MSYSTEEEQDFNNLKAWCSENYKSVIAIFVLVFAGIYGWRYWQHHQIAEMRQASSDYVQLTAKPTTMDLTKLAQFTDTYKGTNYAVFALLDGAKKAATEQDFKQAETLLTQALAQSKDDILTSLTALRLSSIQFQQQNYEAALATLNQVKNSQWEGSKNLLLGEILLAKGNKTEAKTAFENVLKNAGPSEIRSAKVRLNNL